MKNALILHAWYSKPESNWYPWLKSKMQEKDYEVSIPVLPTFDTDQPSAKETISFVENTFSFNEETIVVGHSLSALLGLRLAERNVFNKLILVAGFDFNGLYPKHQLFWDKNIEHNLIKNNVKNIYCISSDNDPYVTAFQAEAMSKRLNAKFILIKKAGHFATTDKSRQIPQLISLL